VIGFTEVLLERYFGELNDKQDEYLQDVLSSGQHLLSLINDILDLSKVEAGRMELELSAFDLEPLLEPGLVMVKERASRKGSARAARGSRCRWRPRTTWAGSRRTSARSSRCCSTS
jgi:signal transduction histidine kinase